MKSTTPHPSPTQADIQTGVWLCKGHGVFIHSTQKRLLDIIQNRRLSWPIKRGGMGAWAKVSWGGVKLWSDRQALELAIQVNADGTAANADI